MWAASYWSPSFWPAIYWPKTGDVPLIQPAVNPFTLDGMVARPIRRLRQAPHISDENKRINYGRFQLDLHAGIAEANGLGKNPVVYLSWSDNGGRTWSKEYPFDLGPTRNYKKRAIWRRLGQARTRQFRVVCSAPCEWVLIAAFIDLVGGGQS